MFARVGLPMVFVFLWSSAFVTGKIAVIYATPFAFLLLRFSIVALLFGGLMLAAKAWLAHQRRKPQTPAQDTPAQDTPAQDTPAQDTPDNWRTLLATAIVGVMLHGFYLGSVFLALSLGIPAGLAALVVSMQPLLSSFLAIFLFAEALRRIQWAGIFLGFVGVAVVLMPTIDGGAGGESVDGRVGGDIFRAGGDHLRDIDAKEIRQSYRPDERQFHTGGGGGIILSGDHTAFGGAAVRLANTVRSGPELADSGRIAWCLCDFHGADQT
jgi:drug/metabolite transporter (DMT)-like permease